MASENSGDNTSLPQTQAQRTFVDLPAETQRAIFSHCSQADLICLSLVSKHFREFAAAQLYRNFHIVFPDEDDPNFDTPIDGLAGGLDTFVTSDYDYAKHLRDLSLDTLSAGTKGEAAYKQYLYNVSCGKFMNTLLLLTLRKANSLETFRWNIRVELSRPVYKALHNIGTLRNLHIRLQAGPSIYETPPPLPFTTSTITTLPPAVSHHALNPPPPLPPGLAVPVFPPPSQTSPWYLPPGSTTTAQITTIATTLPAPKAPTKPKPAKKISTSKEPLTLSVFHDLKSLAVLDIDNLDIITEIKSCMRNSQSTLSKLKLSFSDALGSQARKPPPELDPEDSDPDDEFQVVPMPSTTLGYLDDVSGPARIFRAQEERRSQESVLGRIFDVEPYVVKKPKRRPLDKKDDGNEDNSLASASKNFILAIRTVSQKLMKDLNGVGDLSNQQQDILDIIETAARKYVAAEESKSKDKQKDDSTENAGEGSSGSGVVVNEPEIVANEPDTASDGANGAVVATNAQAVDIADFVVPTEHEVGRIKTEESEVGLFDDKPAAVKDALKDVTPEDINIEEPEEQLESLDASIVKDGQAAEPALETAPTAETTEPKPTVETPPADTEEVSDARTIVAPGEAKAMATLAAQKLNFKILSDKLEASEKQYNALSNEVDRIRDGDNDTDPSNRISVIERQMDGLSSREIPEIQDELASIEAEMDDAQRQLAQDSSSTGASAGLDSHRRRASEYVRSTRGLPLESLSIYLIPVKASVLHKAVDLRTLRRITLLNVGTQAPIWSLLTKENAASPLPLRKIFTDNVSMPFLTLVSQLEEVHELFMLERDSKYKPESFAPKTTTTIDQIRRLVLKKHTHTLKRLMIKNMTNLDWDLDEKAMMMIAKRGKNLEELAVSMGIRAIHVLMQQLQGLINLEALHIIQLRNDDTCVWVMRETKRFLVDTLAHHPELKLEWISMDDDQGADRIIRPSPAEEKEKKSKKAKGKEKAKSMGSASFPYLPVDEMDAGDESDEDDETEVPKFQTSEGVQFADIWGIRIFKKEIQTGRL